MNKKHRSKWYALNKDAPVDELSQMPTVYMAMKHNINMDAEIKRLSIGTYNQFNFRGTVLDRTITAVKCLSEIQKLYFQSI